MIAADPHQGGATWAVLQYVLGLRRLGHDVFLIEPIRSESIRPAGAPLAASTNAAYFHDVAHRFDLTDRATLLRADTHEAIGLSYHGVLDAAVDADLLINISGMLTDAALLERVPRRVYLDLDPAFNQLWHAVEGIDVHLDGHTHFVTIGRHIGAADCPVPTCGRMWVPTWQPVVLPEWPATAPLRDAAWTTVGNWRGYGAITCGGVVYGQKVHSFRRFFDLPQRTGESFQPALSIHPDETRDLDALHDGGWTLVEAAAVAATPDGYRRFIQQSKAEVGIAKSGYVVSRCGWFSDRSVCYLASGRPVVAQDTGFARCLPTGDGLFAFSDIEDAVAAIDAVSGGYEHHCRTARELAEAYFESDRVLNALLDRVGGAHETWRASGPMAVGAAVGVADTA